MGLFDSLGGGGEVELSPQGGLLLAAISMIAIDGDVDDDELAIVRRLDGSTNTVAWEQAVKAWKANDLETCIRLVTGALNADQRMVTIANLVDIAMADGVLVGAEKELLEIYVRALEVPEEGVAKIAEIVALKNNRALFQE